jgi:hypothetical protein
MILGMYLTLLSLILSGVANMIFTKTPIYKKYNYPIDCYKTIRGHRIFGDNKTWIGFVSMILFSIIFQILVGICCNILNITHYNDFYNLYQNTITYNLFVGFLIGFAYMICELPNSFVKRRVNINPGKTIGGLKGITFFVIDQIDSLIGVVFVLYSFSTINIWKCLLYIGLGALTHVSINLILFCLKIRRNL